MLDKLFYVVLCVYREKSSRKADTPLLSACAILTFSLFCIQIIIVDLLRLLFSHSSASEKLGTGYAISALVLCAAIVYGFYIDGGRYVDVYRTHRRNAFLNSKSARRLYWAMIVLSVVSPLIFASIVNKITKGYWI